ncbi:MAG: antirestriction protein [Firmicutes bacterium]|nr:antirestriction protein [Bacillota bacterium]
MSILQKVMTVTLMRADLYDSPAYAGVHLQLPAHQSEMQDALERARITENQPYKTVECCNSQGEYLEFIPENSSLAELNFLAQRISGMKDHEKLIFNNFVAAEKNPTDMKKLINITYNLKECQIIGGIGNDKDLGKFYVENDMVDELRDVPDEVLKYLDYEKIGLSCREAEKGGFIGDSYVINNAAEFHEVYDGVHLPEQPVDEDYVFKLLIYHGDSYPEGEDACTCLKLPAAADDIACVLKERNIPSLDGCVVYKNESTIPRLSGVFSEYEDIDKIRLLADRISELKDRGMMAKYKTVLEFMDCTDIDLALDLTQNLGCFDFHPEMSSPGDYGKLALQKISGLKPDDTALKLLRFEWYGRAMMEQDGVDATEYGLILRNEKELALEYSRPSKGIGQQML